MRSSYSSKVGNITLLFEENDGKDWWKIATSSAFFLCGVNDVNTDTLWQQIQYYLLVKPSLPISPSGCWQTSGFYGHHYDAGLEMLCLIFFDYLILIRSEILVVVRDGIPLYCIVMDMLLMVMMVILMLRKCLHFF